MKKLLAVIVVLCGNVAAHAGFVLEFPPENSVQQSQKLFLDKQSGVTDFTGDVGVQSGGPIIDIHTNLVPADVGNGWSTIQGTQNDLTSIRFTPEDGNLFTDFTTRGQLKAAGNVTITVVDNDNNIQSFSFPENKSDDWPRVGIITTTPGEFIKSVTVSSDDPANIKELKQVTFSIESQAVPEPSTLVMAFMGSLGVIGYATCRRYRRAA